MTHHGSLLSFLRPYLMVASVAFVLGFLCYLAYYKVTNTEEAVFTSSPVQKDEPFDSKKLTCEDTLLYAPSGSFCPQKI